METQAHAKELEHVSLEALGDKRQHKVRRRGKTMRMIRRGTPRGTTPWYSKVTQVSLDILSHHYRKEVVLLPHP
jgi:hypothetical protein